MSRSDRKFFPTCRRLGKGSEGWELPQALVFLTLPTSRTYCPACIRRRAHVRTRTRAHTHTTIHVRKVRKVGKRPVSIGFPASEPCLTGWEGREADA